MAQFQGFICDECGAIVETDDRTRVKIRYEGPVVEGDIKYDLCRDCTSAEVNRHENDGHKVEPIKRRGKRKNTGSEAASPTEPPPVS